MVAAQKNEPSVVARFLLDLAKSYSNFYNEHKIIVEEEDVKQALCMRENNCDHRKWEEEEGQL